MTKPTTYILPHEVPLYAIHAALREAVGQGKLTMEDAKAIWARAGEFENEIMDGKVLVVNDDNKPVFEDQDDETVLTIRG